MAREIHLLSSNMLVIGGGTAGCYAAITASRQAPGTSVLVVEKAAIERSGCLAAGVNALNAYITEGETPESYTEFVRWDAEGILRDDLVLSMAEGFNEAVGDLERMGLVILKDDAGNYVTRGLQNIKINGENIKPLLAAELAKHDNITVLEHVHVTDLLIDNGRTVGAVGFGVRSGDYYILRARSVLICTGGASGLYRPNNPGFSRHKLWYPPFNTGAGYAMGIRAGAEMTSLEMRFVAQRCKDTIAPTGTIALGVGAKEINARGDVIESRYGLTTSGRAFGVTNETHEGRGPCYLRTEGISPEQDEDLLKAYLNMAPAQTLCWVESGRLPSQQNVEVEGSEPYVVGGHTAGGYWVDTGRRTTVRGLYAAGDVSGGAPKKFVTGALAEGRIAAESILADLPDLPEVPEETVRALAEPLLSEYDRHFDAGRKTDGAPFTVFDLEEAMQKVMDEYAGGIRTGYRYNDGQLERARQRIAELQSFAETLSAESPRDLQRVYEVCERLTVAEVLIAHLAARKETRWPGFGVHTDYPGKSEEFECYVNSKVEDGAVKVFTRPLVKEAHYEHTD